jgi:hypothetical protein
MKEKTSVLEHTNEGVEVGLASSNAGLDALEAVTSLGHVTLQIGPNHSVRSNFAFHISFK